MVDWWKDSPPHRRNMLNGDFNYVGIGMSREGAELLYTVVFVNQRDHTPPKAGLISADTGISVAALASTQGRDRPLVGQGPHARDAELGPQWLHHPVQNGRGQVAPYAR